MERLVLRCSFIQQSFLCFTFKINPRPNHFPPSPPLLACSKTTFLPAFCKNLLAVLTNYIFVCPLTSNLYSILSDLFKLLGHGFLSSEPSMAFCLTQSKSQILLCGLQCLTQSDLHSFLSPPCSAQHTDLSILWNHQKCPRLGAFLLPISFMYDVFPSPPPASSLAL